MAKKTRHLGQKLCPNCDKWIKGTRWKTCPHCSYEFQPKVKAIEPIIVVEAPAPVAAPTKADGTITLERIRKVARTVHALGGYENLIEVLDVIKETGGMKKFKDLAEAIGYSEPMDIPF